MSGPDSNRPPESSITGEPDFASCRDRRCKHLETISPDNRIAEKLISSWIPSMAADEQIVVKKNGGARPGAGRKPLAEKYAPAISKAEAQIAASLTRKKDGLPGIIDRMMELAHGVTVQEPDGEGGVRVYTKPPDFKACQYLIDRILGKPTQRNEVTGENGEPIKIAASLTQALDRAYGGPGDAMLDDAANEQP